MNSSKSCFYNEGYDASTISGVSSASNPYPMNSSDWWKHDDWEKGRLDAEADYEDYLYDD